MVPRTMLVLCPTVAKFQQAVHVTKEHACAKTRMASVSFVSSVPLNEAEVQRVKRQGGQATGIINVNQPQPPRWNGRNWVGGGTGRISNINNGK
uniref:Secreted protein n=1 Tax=Globodera pallida TaxID=36090 RepID=A0A183BYA6_GLOPA